MMIMMIKTENPVVEYPQNRKPSSGIPTRRRWKPLPFSFIINKIGKGLKALENELLRLISSSFFRNGESIS